MSKPPILPLNIDGRKMSYFEYLAKDLNPILKNFGVSLDFSGYKDTIKEYSMLNECDTKKAWELSRDLNMWSEYFSDLSNLVNKLLLDSETEKIKIIAIASFEADNKKVSNGDRLANKDERVIKIRKQRNSLQAFYGQLESKINFLEKAYHHCKATCSWNNISNKSFEK